MSKHHVAVDESGDGQYSITVAALHELMTRDNVEYLDSLGGVEAIAKHLSTSTQNGLSDEEAASGYAHRINAHVL